MHVSVLQFIGATLSGLLAFGGQQVGKDKEYQREKETKIIQMRWDACEKLKQCDPLIHYLEVTPSAEPSKDGAK